MKLMVAFRNSNGAFRSSPCAEDQVFAVLEYLTDQFGWRYVCETTVRWCLRKASNTSNSRAQDQWIDRARPLREVIDK